MKSLKYFFTIVSCIFLLVFSFIFHVYSVDYEIGYQPIYITYNDEIELSIHANPTSSNFFWLPFFAHSQRSGPYKVVLFVEDIEKKWDEIKITNFEYENWDSEIFKLQFTGKDIDRERMTFPKKIDPNYETETFHVYTPESVTLDSNININVEFLLSNQNEEKSYKFKTFMQHKTSKRSHWFMFISA